MDIIYDDEMPECEWCGEEPTLDDVTISLSEWKQILCDDCMNEM